MYIVKDDFWQKLFVTVQMKGSISVGGGAQ